MFNDTFYPTPDDVIEKMLAPHIYKMDDDDDNENRRSFFRGRRFLTGFRNIIDPSAGKGNILDFMQKKFDRNDHRFFCIEIEPELQMILIEKGYQLVGYDFLSHADYFAYDLFIMNPPFDQGVAHLLHAWALLQDGNIICLLNAESVLNAYTDERKLLVEIIKQHGTVEYIGQAFKDSERPTDVEVCIVRLKKSPSADGTTFDVYGMKKDGRVSEDEFSANPLASRDVIASLVAQYNRAQELTIGIHRMQSEYDFYVRNIIEMPTPSNSPTEQEREDARKAADMRQTAKMGLNDALVELKKHFWRYVFNKTKLGSKMTTNFQRDFETTLTRTFSIAFTEDNIIKVLETFMFNINDIVKDAIVEIFDQCTSYHEKNIVQSEAWKTNKSWKIAKRIILPHGIDYDKDSYHPWQHRYYGHDMEFYRDIDKVLCFISGTKIETIYTLSAAIKTRCDYLNDHHAEDYHEPFYCHHFKVTFYKKGTVHLDFMDLDLLARFNQMAAANKHWVGGGY